MEKIILVYYIYIGDMNPVEVEDFIKQINESLSDIESQHNILSFIIPSRTEDTRIECINPKVVSEEDYKQAKKVLSGCKKKVNEFIKSYQKQE